MWPRAEHGLRWIFSRAALQSLSSRRNGIPIRCVFTKVVAVIYRLVTTVHLGLVKTTSSLPGKPIQVLCFASWGRVHVTMGLSRNPTLGPLLGNGNAYPLLGNEED